MHLHLDNVSSLESNIFSLAPAYPGALMLLPLPGEIRWRKEINTTKHKILLCVSVSCTETGHFYCHLDASPRWKLLFDPIFDTPINHEFAEIIKSCLFWATYGRDSPLHCREHDTNLKERSNHLMYLFEMYKTQMGTNSFHAAVDIEDSYPLHTKETRSVNLLHSQHIFLRHCRILTATVHHWKLHMINNVHTHISNNEISMTWTTWSICAKPSKLGQERGHKKRRAFLPDRCFLSSLHRLSRDAFCSIKDLYITLHQSHMSVIKCNSRNR